VVQQSIKACTIQQIRFQNLSMIRMQGSIPKNQEIVLSSAGKIIPKDLCSSEPLPYTGSKRWVLTECCGTWNLLSCLTRL